MKPKKIYYAAVSGNVSGTYLCWKDRQVDETQLARTYSEQFFDLCFSLGAKAIVSFPFGHAQPLKDNFIEIKERPSRVLGSGLAFHFRQILDSIWLCGDVIRTRADHVIVMDGIVNPYLLIPLVCLGRTVYVSQHTVLWREGQHVGFVQRLIRKLNSFFFRRFCAGCLVASEEIARQVRSLSEGSDLKISKFLPSYRNEIFLSFGSPVHEDRPFRILYAGRIEEEKGVFDILRSVQELMKAGYDLRLDYCGNGSAFGRLKNEIEHRGLNRSVVLHGHLMQRDFTQMLAKSHVVVVPTRSSFPEGFNQVVVEAILARRPVITSRICPSITLVREAVVEAMPDDVDSYTASIRELFDDRQLFAAKVRSADRLREQFFRQRESWISAALLFFRPSRPLEKAPLDDKREKLNF